MSGNLLLLVLLCVFLYTQLQSTGSYLMEREFKDTDTAEILWTLVVQSSHDMPALERAVAYYLKNPSVSAKLAILVPLDLKSPPPSLPAHRCFYYRVPRVRLYSEFPKGETHIRSITTLSPADTKLLGSWLALKEVPPCDCTHIVSLPLSTTYANLETVRCCSLSSLLFLENDLMDAHEAAVGFQIQKLAPYLEVLQDMTHLSTLRLRLDTLKYLCSFSTIKLADL